MAEEQKLAVGRIFIFIIIVLAIIGAAFWKWGLPLIKERQEASKYDKASVGGKFENEVTVAGDPWSGYSLFRSDKFRSFLNSLKIGSKYEHQEDLKKRFAGLANGKYDFVVATIDGYTLNGLESNYPGVIIFLVDESDGGDSIIGGPNVQSIDDLEMRKVAYSAGYPSEHLLDVTLTHFDILAVERVPVRDGLSEESYNMLTSGKVDAAVVWEPETSQAEKDGYKILTSTKDSDDIIIDVCIASRDIVIQKPDVVQNFVRAYFKTLEFYERNRTEFTRYLGKDGGITTQVAQHVYDGIDFTDIGENNYLWFGIGEGAELKIDRIIDETIAIQSDNGKLVVNPFDDKQGRAFWIVNSTFLEAMSGEAKVPALKGKFKVEREVAKKPVVETRQFTALDSTELEQDTERVGEIDVKPIYFATGSSFLGPNAKPIVDEFARTFAHYPNYRLVLHGYSSPTGSPEVNMRLSEERANSIKQYLISNRHNMQSARINIVAHGDREPLPRQAGESEPEWLQNNQRTEFVLVKER